MERRLFPVLGGFALSVFENRFQGGVEDIGRESLACSNYRFACVGTGGGTKLKVAAVGIEKGGAQVGIRKRIRRPGYRV